MSNEFIIRAESVSKTFDVWSSPSARFFGPLYRGLAQPPFLPTKLRNKFSQQASQACRKFHALNDISFEIPRGQSVGIIGRNGAGKSTLLQIITGTLAPSSGRLEIRGSIAALLELGSGFNPEFTGRENARLNATLHGLTSRQIDERLDSILAFAEIGDFIDQPVKTYSSGMTIRLAFAVVAHLNADILIVDEALAVGDTFFVQKCMRFLRKFQETGVLLMVTHSSENIKSLCQRAIWLDQGNMKLDGDPKKVTEAYLEAFFSQENQSRFGKATNTSRAKTVSQSTNKQDNTFASSDVPLEKFKPLTDQRLKYINNSPHRNDLQVFEFNPNAKSFGTGEGEIVSVSLEDEEGRSLTWVVGGEIVTLRIQIECKSDFKHPIVGFYVKNHLGQHLFGDNTFFNTQKENIACSANTLLEAHFTFQMVILPPGDYCFVIALADGNVTEHIMHHWMHDALIFKSTASPMQGRGLIGIPMFDIGLTRVSATASTAA